MIILFINSFSYAHICSEDTEKKCEAKCEILGSDKVAAVISSYKFSESGGSTNTNIDTMIYLIILRSSEDTKYKRNVLFTVRYFLLLHLNKVTAVLSPG